MFGTINLASTLGLSFVNGTGIDNTHMVFLGGLAEVQAATHSLLYRPPLYFNGYDKLTIQVSDQTYEGAGDGRTALELISINVASINTPPVINAPVDYTVKEDIRSFISVLSIIDPDIGSEKLRVSIRAGNGLLSLNRPDDTSPPTPAPQALHDPCSFLKLNLGGYCTNLPTGFKLTQPAGLTFNRHSFDDNNVEAGNSQPINVCLLALYGNAGVYARVPNASSFAVADGPPTRHFFGDCGFKDSCSRCLNSDIVQNGVDFGSFAKGQSCESDVDLDSAWTELSCFWSDGQPFGGKF
jgi:hypothetical protein